jgi:hypothetical protein
VTYRELDERSLRLAKFPNEAEFSREAGLQCVADLECGIHDLSSTLLARCFRHEAIAPIERVFRQTLGRPRLPAR